MKNITLISLITAAFVTHLSAANLIVNGDFEDTTGTFPTGWSTSGTITQDTVAPELIGGSTSARMAGGAIIAQQTLGGLSDFTFEFLFRPRFDTDHRSANLVLHGGGTTGTGGGSESLNLRVSGTADAGSGSTLQVYDGAAWQMISGANFFSTGDTFRMQLTASDWGSGSGTYDLAWSDANAIALTNSATGLSHFQNSDFVLDRARFLAPANSYNLDNVILEAIPEPTPVMLTGLVALGLVVRRRRRA